MSPPGIGFFGGGVLFIAASTSLFLMHLLHGSEWIPGAHGDYFLHHQHHISLGHSVWKIISTLHVRYFGSFRIRFPLLHPENLDKIFLALGAFYDS